ncbi:MauE/DoxX family redox-associated membrane protein [Nonomuraea sp. NPDC052265]|uniref:MauE/DoxX family redox-associated membrane protein n=1 Tax=Nonomuraea sp. NPDC052265 TaxID=3364374 RepID=UPI0037C7B436
MRYVALACRVALGVVLLVAVLGKACGGSAFAGFRGSVRGLFPLGTRAATASSGAVVLAEGCVVVPLATPGTVRAGIMPARTVLVGFCAGIVTAMRSGSATPCSVLAVIVIFFDDLADLFSAQPRHL